MGIWIVFTIMAVVMQAVRTAAQKNMSNHLSPLTVTFVRYGFGLPVGLIYLGGLFYFLEVPWVQISKGIEHSRFWVFVVVASICQILATAFVIKLFSYRNFSVAIAFSKTEAMMAGIFATVFFHDYLSMYGWIAVVVGVIGIVLLSKIDIKQLSTMPKAALFYGVGSGVLFAWTSLSLREASLVLELPLIFSASMTLVFMLILQTIICFVLIKWFEPDQILKLKSHKSIAWFVGITSALGSIGWFSAMSLQQVAIVKTLGQLEIVLMLLISIFYFKEVISKQEWLGIGLISMSVVFIFL
ncbi:EamA family transporter [Marinicellulosiphila megalodicopiae]|uniref:EamA family transporter n=1 Tax=Marinicellulosiphila megalodicopiae TaxID=2724896 RepID=UPI003BAE7392